MAPADQTNIRSRTQFARRLVGLVILGFLSLVLAAGATAWLQTKNQEDSGWVEHTLDVEARIGAFAALNERIETARRGYLMTRDSSFRHSFDQASEELPRELDGIAAAIADNPRQRVRVANLRELVAAQREMQLRSLSMVDRGQAGAVIGRFRDDPAVLITRRIRELAGDMAREERGLFGQRSETQTQTLRSFYGLMIAAGLLLIGVAAISIMVILRYMRELRESEEELRHLNEDLEDVVEERTADLQRANEEIQRFAYIVSHDLRSPLVNVMGFTAELEAARKTVSEFVDGVAEQDAETVPEDVRLAVKEDLPEAIGFIRTSTEKMDRLINAILRLSREGRRTLAPEPVDATALVQTIADSLKHRTDELGIRIDVEALPPITTDRLALEQILSNLIENATKYLKRGRPGEVRISGEQERDRIVYAVSDNGRGIDPKDHERIFDLFRRSGSQDQPGEGIGLAHVRALAYRLGGTVDVASELDEGATFRVSLPTRFGGGDER